MGPAREARRETQPAAAPRRICFVATLPITLKAFVLPQAAFLSRSGWDVTWVCAPDAEFARRAPEWLRYRPMPFRRGLDALEAPLHIWRLYRFFARERFDIVQYSTPNAALYASVAAWLARQPVRLYAQWGIRYVGFAGAPRKLFKLLERVTCACSTVVEPDSRSNLEFAVAEGLYRRGKARVVWNGSASGVDLQRFDVSQRDRWREQYRRRLGWDASHRVVGFVGALRRDKGSNELLAAARRLASTMPRFRLLLVGDKELYGSVDGELRAWADASPQVVYVPSTSEVPQYMSCMDVFTLPSYREGFGSVVVEAQAMGLPVVVSDVPGPVDAMKEGETGLVVPVRNADRLAAGLEALIDDDELRERLGRAAVRWAATRFEQRSYLEHVLADKNGLL
ncbi:MAG TPA: glycosyltransferase family 4 protein [Myxococcales bacterium]|jgi:glycosyltransferase involved in cell wall biosynthesis